MQEFANIDLSLEKEKSDSQHTDVELNAPQGAQSSLTVGGVDDLSTDSIADTSTESGVVSPSNTYANSGVASPSHSVSADEKVAEVVPRVEKVNSSIKIKTISCANCCQVWCILYIAQ